MNDNQDNEAGGMTLDEIAYAISKQVPNMLRGFYIHTDYGDVFLYGRDAERVADLVLELLRDKLRQRLPQWRGPR